MTEPAPRAEAAVRQVVLVVDDDPVHRTLMRGFLSGEFTVFDAATGAEGLEVARAQRPDLVLLDYNLPDATGLQLLPKLRELGSIVVMLTGEGDEEMAVSAVQSGASDFMPKHRLDVHRLQRTIQYAFEHRALQDAVYEAGRQRDLFAEVVSQAAEAVLITDIDGVIEDVNPAFERISGYTPEEVVGQNPRLLRSGEQDQAFYGELWQTVLAGGVWSGRMVNRRKDGTLYHIDATISPMKSPDGQIVRFLAFQKDVTREVELERQLAAAQRLEAVGHLAGGIAHDFNNLMTVILGNVEMALEDLPEEHHLAQGLREVRQAALSGRSLTKRLLAFGRKQMLRPKVLSLNSVVSQMEAMISRVLGDDIELRVRLGGGISPVKADPVQLQSIMLNLSLNARDAMPDGGILTIETSQVDVDEAYQDTHPGGRRGRFVTLTVSDSGHGMDAETLERVFQPFFTTKDEGTGSGLGLAMVYGTVKQSGGNIWVYSEPGEGATFKILLPAVEDAASPAPTPAAHPLLAEGSRRVLLVEDQDAVRRSVYRMLTKMGYEVEEEADAAVALARVQEDGGAFDVLVSDVVMPRMSGLELADRISEFTPALRVLFVSGHSADVVFKRQMPKLPHAFLEKPFTYEELTRALNDLLDGA